MPFYLPRKSATGKDIIDPLRLSSEISNRVMGELSRGGSNYNNSELGQYIANFESLQKANHAAVYDVQSCFSDLSAALENLGIDDFNFGEQPEAARAGAMASAIAAASDAKQYHALFLSSTMESKNHVDELGGIRTFDHVSDTMDIREKYHPSMESFDNMEASNFAGDTFLYNMRTSVQNEFSDMWFKGVSIAVDLGGMDVTIPNLNVFSHYEHNTSGAPADMKKRRLLEAAIDHTILANDATKLVPEVAADNSNAEYFVPASAVPPQTKQFGTRFVRTAPLKINTKLNFLAAASGSMADASGRFDSTDALDGAAGIERIYLQMGTTDVISFYVKDTADSFFMKTPNTRRESFFLNLNNVSLQINRNTRLHSGGPLTNTTLLDIIDDQFTLVLDVRLTGNLDREIANGVVDAGTTVTVRKAYNAQGVEVLLTDPSVAAAVTAIRNDLHVIGYDPDMRLTNSNRRIRKLQLDVTPWTDRYPIRYLPPISFPVPTSDPTANDSQKINWLITAVNITNDNNAITKLKERQMQLEQYVMLPSSAEDQDVMDVEGIQRMCIPRPWMMKATIPVDKRINSLNSHDKLRDIKAVIRNAISDAVFQMIRDTNIQNALDAFTGYSGKKMKVIIGTDPYLARFIEGYNGGDELEAGLKFRKAVTYDSRFRDEIHVSLSLDVEGYNMFNHGAFLNMPPLVSTLQVNRNQATIREIMIQPRNRHIVNACYVIVFKVTGISETLVGGVPLRVLNKVATASVFEDVVSP